MWAYYFTFLYFWIIRRRIKCLRCNRKLFNFLQLSMKSSHVNRYSSIMGTTPSSVGKRQVLQPPKKNFQERPCLWQYVSKHCNLFDGLLTLTLLNVLLLSRMESSSGNDRVQSKLSTNYFCCTNQYQYLTVATVSTLFQWHCYAVMRKTIIKIIQPKKVRCKARHQRLLSLIKPSISLKQNRFNANQIKKNYRTETH